MGIHNPLFLQDLGQLVVHDFGHPDQNEVLYTAQKAQIGGCAKSMFVLIHLPLPGVIFHPIERTVLSVTEIFHKPDIYVANTTVLVKNAFWHSVSIKCNSLKMQFFARMTCNI
jgi:hypothetical protein